MTRLDAMKALLACPAQDNHRRAVVVKFAHADRLKLHIESVKVRRKARRKRATSSRIGWLKGVHERQGA
jgi:hypothetical protein